MADTKGRILFLERYMLEHTDDEHSITTDELIRIYEENGYKANRNTIRDDVTVLNAAGIEILSERVGNGKVYHIGARLFELAELKMLVDAVSSSRFITMGKSEMLISKLAKLTNEQNRAALTARIFTADRIKSGNTAVFNTTDTICRAMEAEKKIRFHYWNYNPQKEHILRHDGEWFIASPYALIWDDERYYLAAYSDFREKVVTFRVDRMCDVEITEAVVDTAVANGYTDLYKKQLITLTEFEKMMGKKRFAELLGEYVAKPPGKLALVPEDDPRPPVDLNSNPDQEFAVLTDGE